jgi:predicted dehydrogenase
MMNVGVMGLGMMGLTHLDVYAKLKDAKVVAISDKDPNRLEGRVKAQGNVEGQAQGGFDFAAVERKYAEGREMIADPNVQIVDVCLPTHLHVDYALAALNAGKHVFIEKPLARTYADAQRLADAAGKSSGIAMVGMCLRFWPGWTWLKDAVANRTYGKVLAAHFRRVAAHPGGPFYLNGDLNGGAALDLHIHDTDFVQYLFGVPKSVYSAGYSKVTNQIDHIVTHYHYDDVPLVIAEGSWAMTDGYPFKMQFTVNFERATCVYDFPSEKPMTLYEKGKSPAVVELDPTMGYQYEIEYFLECVRTGKRPTKVTMQDAANTIRIVEAEVRSAQSRQTVSL